MLYVIKPEFVSKWNSFLVDESIDKKRTHVTAPDRYRASLVTIFPANLCSLHSRRRPQLPT